MDASKKACTGNVHAKMQKGAVNLGNITWSTGYAKHPKSVFSIPKRKTKIFK